MVSAICWFDTQEHAVARATDNAIIAVATCGEAIVVKFTVFVIQCVLKNEGDGLWPVSTLKPKHSNAELVPCQAALASPGRIA